VFDFFFVQRIYFYSHTHGVQRLKNNTKKHSIPMVMALVRGMASVTSTSKFGGPTSLWSFWHKPRPCAFCFTKKHGNIFKTKTQYLFVKLVLVLKKKNQLSIWTPPRDYHLNGAPHVGTGG
jgi:hypothetical protein